MRHRQWQRKGGGLQDAPPPSHLSLEENKDVTIIVHLMCMYREVLSITPVSMLLAYKVIKDISIGMGGGGDRVIRNIAFSVMVEKNSVMICLLPHFI